MAILAANPSLQSANAHVLLLSLIHTFFMCRATQRAECLAFCRCRQSRLAQSGAIFAVVCELAAPGHIEQAGAQEQRSVVAGDAAEPCVQFSVVVFCMLAC